MCSASFFRSPKNLIRLKEILFCLKSQLIVCVRSPWADEKRAMDYVSSIAALNRVVRHLSQSLMVDKKMALKVSHCSLAQMLYRYILISPNLGLSARSIRCSRTSAGIPSSPPTFFVLPSLKRERERGSGKCEERNKASVDRFAGHKFRISFFFCEAFYGRMADSLSDGSLEPVISGSGWCCTETTMTEEGER